MSETEQKKKQRERKHPAVVDETADDFFETLNGFDEIAIKKAFGVPVAELSPDAKGQGGDVFQFLRALIFVHRRREGENDITAYNAAQNLRTAELNDYFADESAESGKDNSAPETPPKTSPPGASTPNSPPSPTSD
jgi:hypothetical protein